MGKMGKHLSPHLVVNLCCMHTRGGGDPWPLIIIMGMCAGTIHCQLWLAAWMAIELLTGGRAWNVKVQSVVAVEVVAAEEEIECRARNIVSDTG